MRKMETLGNYLKELRLDIGISTVELAQRSDLSRVTISKLENNRVPPGVKALKKLAKSLRVSYTKLRQVQKRFQKEGI